MPHFWRATTSSSVDISGNFTSRKFIVALQHLKPGKPPGLDSIFPKLILRAGSALKPWFCDFLSFRWRPLKIPKIWRIALIVEIPSQRSPRRTLRAIVQYYRFVCPTRSLRDLSIPVWNQLSIHSSVGSRLDFDTGDQP